MPFNLRKMSRDWMQSLEDRVEVVVVLVSRSAFWRAGDLGTSYLGLPGSGFRTEAGCSLLPSSGENVQCYG